LKIPARVCGWKGGGIQEFAAGQERWICQVRSSGSHLPPSPNLSLFTSVGA